MKPYILYAIAAGIAWGLGGYFEKAGLRTLGLPPLAGIMLRTTIAFILLGALSVPVWKTYTPSNNIIGWVMIILGGGVIAGTLGMWSFYASLSTAENLGVALAVAFALSPVTGTIVGLLTRTQSLDWRSGIGLCAIIVGIVLIQLAHKPKP
ncbi:MAG: hypothetical protein C4326_00145 [Ignavibacteria bacterium]